MDVSSVVLLIVGLLVGSAAGYALASGIAARRTAVLQAEAAAARATAEALNAQQGELQQRTAHDSNVLQALAPLSSSLDQVQQRIASLERERTEQFTALRQQLQDARRGETELRQVTAQL